MRHLTRSSPRDGRHLALLIFAAAFMLPSAVLRADEVRLKNGSTFEGRIVKEDDRCVMIDIGGGSITFPRREIASIVRTPSPPVDVKPDPAKAAPADARKPAKPAPASPAPAPTARAGRAGDHRRTGASPPHEESLPVERETERRSKKAAPAESRPGGHPDW